ncbi:MAG: 50S ribosomal protein L24 [Candidatus Aenigmarchaeota archaeon]|nr:50S ribosomal protein L24 [Candidatus Aenigmarchaeota archaeon]
MRKKFSKAWLSSSQPRKQRKYRYNAPLHLRHKLLAAHLSRELRKEYGRRALPVRKDDEVAVITGARSGAKGKVTRVDMGSSKIYVDNVKRKKVSGQEVQLPIDPSNVVITKLALEDKERKNILERKKGKTEVKAESKPPKKEKAEQKPEERK